MQLKTLGIVVIRLFAIYSVVSSFRFLPQSLNTVFAYDLGFFDLIKSTFIVFVMPLIIPLILWLLAPQISNCLSSSSDENVNIGSLNARQIFKLGVALFGLSLIPWAIASLISSFVSLSSVPLSAGFSDFNAGTKGLIFVNFLQLAFGVYLLVYTEHFISKLEKFGADFTK